MPKNKEKTSASQKNKISLRSLVYDNKFVLLLSVVLAFCIWIWVSVEKSPEIETTISSVPVTIDMTNSVPSQLNLQIFGNTEHTVDITVRGKRFVVSSLTADDFTVTAQTNYVDSAGNKSLQIKVSANNSANDFEITGYSKNYIEVYFDTYKETELALEPSILSANGKTVIDGCLLGTMVFSKNTVIVSGPSTEVNKITSVIAETTLSEPLAATTTVTPEIKLAGANGSQISYVEVETGDTAITMTMPVLKTVELPTTVTFRNAPASYLNGAVPFTVTPSRISAAVPVETADQLTALSIGTIDFSELDTGYNVFRFSASEITGFVITDSSVKTFRVNVNMSGTTTSEFSVPAGNISITGQRSGFTSVVSSQGIPNVKVIGPSDSIARLSDDMLKVQLDLSNYNVKAGQQNVPVYITVSADNSCWVSGNYYVSILSETAGQ